MRGRLKWTLRRRSMITRENVKTGEKTLASLKLKP